MKRGIEGVKNKVADATWELFLAELDGDLCQARYAAAKIAALENEMWAEEKPS